MGMVAYRKIEVASYLDDATAYEVRLDGKKVGTVVSRREESWRKSGRVRTSLRGRPRLWGYGIGDKVATNFFYYRRDDAMRRLLANAKEQ
jgi:hypothetical protein